MAQRGRELLGLPEAQIQSDDSDEKWPRNESM